MRKHFIALALILITFIMVGCDFYFSEVPISNSKKSKIDSSVIGSWGYFKNDTLVVAMKISPLNERELMVNFVSLDDPKKIIDFYQNYVVHNTKIKNTNYINVRILEGKYKDKYVFFTYKLKGDSLTLFVLENKKFTKIFNTSNSLYKNIKQHNEEFLKFFTIFDGNFIRIKTH